MATTSPWPLIHAEREALIADLGTLNRVADFHQASNLIVGAKQRVDGLTLRATDTGWSTGSGPEVTGPHLSLILAMTGRKAALPELSGAGVDTLKSRS